MSGYSADTARNLSPRTRDVLGCTVNRRRMTARRIIVLALACALLGAAPPRTTELYGFTVPARQSERRFESMFRDIPSAQGALDVAAVVAARPHYAGSYGDEEL